MKKIIALAMAMFVALSLSACGGSANALPDSLDGRWVSEKNGIVFEGYISDERIQVYMVVNDMEGLYWEGDFVMPEENDGEEIMVESIGNAVALDSSLYGSMSDAKTFLYSDGVLSFDFSMVGVNTVIKLESANV